MMQVMIPALGGVVADCWLSEEHGRELEITENPVEFGAPIVDHAFIKPQQLTIEFGVSNYPIGLIDDIFGEVGTNRIEAARDILFDMQNKRLLLNVNTLSGGRYRRMMLQSVSWRTDKKTVNAVIFALKLKEIKITQTQEIQYTPIPNEPRTQKQVAAAKKKGEKPAKALPAPTDKSAKPADKAKADAAAKQEKAIATKQGGSILAAWTGYGR